MIRTFNKHSLLMIRKERWCLMMTLSMSLVMMIMKRLKMMGICLILFVLYVTMEGNYYGK